MYLKSVLDLDWRLKELGQSHKKANPQINYIAGGTMNSSVVLSIGDTYHLRFGKDRIVYAGMPSDKIFSVVQMKWEFFMGDTPGIYFSP